MVVTQRSLDKTEATFCHTLLLDGKSGGCETMYEPTKLACAKYTDADVCTSVNVCSWTGTMCQLKDMGKLDLVTPTVSGPAAPVVTEPVVTEKVTEPVVTEEVDTEPVVAVTA